METWKPERTALTVLALCFALAMLGRGAGETFSVFLLPVSSSFGWDRAEVISVYSLASLSMGLASPFVGRLFDRSGPRVVYGLGLTLLGAGFSLAAFAQTLWQLQLSVGVAAGLQAQGAGIRRDIRGHVSSPQTEPNRPCGRNRTSSRSTTP